MRGKWIGVKCVSLLFILYFIYLSEIPQITPSPGSGAA